MKQFRVPCHHLLLASALSLLGCARAEQETVLVPADQAFILAGDLVHDRDLSAVARGDGHLGVIASDEGATIQIIEFARNGSGAFVIRNHTLDPFDAEIDFEAATFLNGWYYVCGSHGAAKKSGIYEEARARMYRFQIDDTGQIREPVEMFSLASLFDRLPELEPYHRRPLQAKGLNIEGLAARGDALYAGLRSPHIDGQALVVRMDTHALADGPPTQAELFKIPVDNGLGIRAMATARDGFLLIVSNAGSEASQDQPNTQDYEKGRKAELIYWEPDSGHTEHWGRFPRYGKGKEEAILSLPSENGGRLDFVVFYDSKKGGAPKRFSVLTPN